jgi:site-specific recombinase XerD
MSGILWHNQFRSRFSTYHLLHDNAAQVKALLKTINVSTAEGFRDYTMVLTLLDTGLRISELTGLKAEDLRLEDGLLEVMGIKVAVG